MQKYLLLKEIFEVEEVPQTLKTCKTFSVEDLLTLICKDSYNLTELGCTATTVAKWMKRCFPDRASSHARLDNYLLHKYGYKECRHCSKIKELSSETFHKNAGTADGYNSYCSVCQNILTAVTSVERQAKYRASKLQRTPSWVTLEEQQKIAQYYYNCPPGYQVDHILPLQGEFVSGFHVFDNLQYLTTEENQSKSNKYSPV
jgi:hypothetical protein